MTEYGVVPLMWTTLDAWSRLNRVDLEPAEIEALMQCDGVLVAPGTLEGFDGR